MKKKERETERGGDVCCVCCVCCVCVCARGRIPSNTNTQHAKPGRGRGWLGERAWEHGKRGSTQKRKGGRGQRMEKRGRWCVCVEAPPARHTNRTEPAHKWSEEKSDYADAERKSILSGRRGQGAQRGRAGGQEGGGGLWLLLLLLLPLLLRPGGSHPRRWRDGRGRLDARTPRPWRGPRQRNRPRRRARTAAAARAGQGVGRQGGGAVGRPPPPPPPPPASPASPTPTTTDHGHQDLRDLRLLRRRGRPLEGVRGGGNSSSRRGRGGGGGNGGGRGGRRRGRAAGGAAQGGGVTAASRIACSESAPAALGRWRRRRRRRRVVGRARALPALTRRGRGLGGCSPFFAHPFGFGGRGWRG